MRFVTASPFRLPQRQHSFHSIRNGRWWIDMVAFFMSTRSTRFRCHCRSFTPLVSHIHPLDRTTTSRRWWQTSSSGSRARKQVSMSSEHSHDFDSPVLFHWDNRQWWTWRTKQCRSVGKNQKYREAGLVQRALSFVDGSVCVCVTLWLSVVTT